MSDMTSKAELMRSLGRLVRGLSALFWGLPITLLVCVKTATGDWLKPFGVFPPVFSTGLLVYGVWQLGYFQKQERIWHHALDRAKLLGIVNVGLSPFVFWWNQIPYVSFYALTVGVLMLSGLLFLFNLNQVLQRLVAMLPDETLRLETKVFTSFNLYLLAALVSLITVYFVLQQIRTLPPIILQVLGALEVAHHWVLTLLVLLPLAMTMTLIWKIKEAILASVFGPEA